jgi:hypothetical protein
LGGGGLYTELEFGVLGVAIEVPAVGCERVGVISGEVKLVWGCGGG